MTTFPDLSSFEDETTNDGLALPINGKEYVFTGDLSLGTALQLQRIRAEGARIAEDKQAAEAAGEKYDVQPSDEFMRFAAGADQKMYLDLVGKRMQDQLAADGVTYRQTLRIGITLLAWHLRGRDHALDVWKTGRLDGGANPPAKTSGSSKAPTTSRSSSTKKPRTSSKARASRSRTTSTGGRSSKPTSTASTE